MSEKKIKKLPVLTTHDKEFRDIARMVSLPEINPTEGIQFFPAFDGFFTGSEGAEQIDISYLYVPWHREALHEFDKHPHNEELFIALQGDFYMIIGSAEGGEYPVAEEMHCFHIKEGDMFVQKANVWHTACWPIDPSRPVKYIMILSGHRAVDNDKANSEEGEGNRLDHNIRPLTNNFAVIPDFR